MNELINISYDSDRPLVSARELHEFLEVGADFPHWFSRMCEYGFSEECDYRTFLTDRADGLPGKPRQDAMITMDEIDTTFAREQKATNPRISKYTAKYHK